MLGRKIVVFHFFFCEGEREQASKAHLATSFLSSFTFSTAAPLLLLTLLFKGLFPKLKSSGRRRRGHFFAIRRKIERRRPNLTFFLQTQCKVTQ